jgi:amino acid transporter
MIVPPPLSAPAPRASLLRRELGRWDLTAIGVNQVIGSAVFVMPAALAANAGAWSPWIVAAVGLGSMLIALSFAEVSSRFESTGGPYLYTRAAFGRFPAFQVGWLLWFTRAASWASVISVLVLSLGFYFPAVTAGWPRAAVIAGTIGVLAFINIRGIRQSSLVVNAFTIGKLTPLVMFILVGLFSMSPAVLSISETPALTDVSATALLLIFAFGGYEVVPVPAGEARDPRTAVPFALVMTLIVVTVVMVLVQVVALGTYPDLGSSKTPLADASGQIMGPLGAALMTFGAVVSTTGNNMGQALSGSRNLFALAEQGDLPAVFARVHPRFRTPIVAILVTSGVALVLALTGTFVKLATASAISRLVVYVATCASTLRLRTPAFDGQVAPATFIVPLGPLIPLAAIAISLSILAGASAAQLTGGAWAIAAGAVLYLIAIRGRSRITREESVQ